ncbi:iron-containing alcohol dehydrogenase [Pasteurellaceae bacterium LIM206]|nr:iron-containing alcohol dehydrogenase [Pasteurellaceae bacterium LIM206]
MSVYSLFNPNKVIGGAGSITQIAEVVQGYKAKNVVLITDAGIFKTGLIAKPQQILEQTGIAVYVIGDVPPEPSIEAVNHIFSQAVDFNADMVVGIGGGSVMDAAKLVALMLSNPMIGLKEVTTGQKKFIQHGLPTLMIPTTSGTGSEATQNAIVLDNEQELKIGIVDEKLMASAVILDAELTIGLPKHITANTGIDALCHAIECYISKKASPFSDIFALKAIELIVGNIRQAFNHGQDIEAREKMLLGSFLGGACITTSSTVAVHALSYPLGGKYHIPHGLSNAILLPDVMQFNLPACMDKFANVAKAMGLNVQGCSTQQAAEKMIYELYMLIHDLDIKCDLTAVGISEEILDELADSAFKVRRLLDNNPREMTKADIKAIYHNII